MEEWLHECIDGKNEKNYTEFHEEVVRCLVNTLREDAEQ